MKSAAVRMDFDELVGSFSAAPSVEEVDPFYIPDPVAEADVAIVEKKEPAIFDGTKPVRSPRPMRFPAQAHFSMTMECAEALELAAKHESLTQSDVLRMALKSFLVANGYIQNLGAQNG